MPWNLYDRFREDKIDGNPAFDLEAATVMVALVTATYTPNQNTHDFFDDITNEVVGTGYTAGGNAAAVPTVTLSGAGLITFDANDPATWAQNAAGFNNARRAIIWVNTAGAPATDPLIAFSDSFAADRGNTDGDFSIQFSANGIFTSPR